MPEVYTKLECFPKELLIRDRVLIGMYIGISISAVVSSKHIYILTISRVQRYDDHDIDTWRTQNKRMQLEDVSSFLVDYRGRSCNWQYLSYLLRGGSRFKATICNIYSAVKVHNHHMEVSLDKNSDREVYIPMCILDHRISLAFRILLLIPCISVSLRSGFP